MPAVANRSVYLAARVAGEVSEVESSFGEAFIERFFGVERCALPTACNCLLDPRCPAV